MKLFIIQRKDNAVPSFDCQLLVITEGVTTRGDECSPVGREMIARTPSAWPWKHGRDSLACMVTYGVIEKKTKAINDRWPCAVTRSGNSW